MAVKPLIIKIIGDNTDFDRSMNEVDSKLGNFGKMVGAAAVGLAAVGGAAAVGLFKLGSTFDESFDQIRIGTGATGDALAALQDDFKAVAGNVPEDFGSVSTAIADINTRLGLTGVPLQELSTQFLELSRITGTDVANNVDKITRVFGDWGVSVEDQAATMDELFRASQNSGIGIDELASSLVQFGAPLRNVGFSLQESQALLAVFNKTGVNTETVIAGLKAGVGKLAKAGEDVPETFKRIVAEITALGPGSEATALAIELFGQRAGPDLADAIAGGKFELEEMLAAIEGGQDTISGAADDTASFGEAWNTLKNKVFVLLEPLATKLFSAIGNGIEALLPYIDTFKEGLITLKAAFTEGDDFGAEGFSGFMAKIGLVLRDAYSLFTQVKEGFTTLKAAFVEGDDFGADGIAGVMGKIGIALGKAYDLFNKVKDAVSSFLDRFRSGEGEAGETAAKLGKIVGQLQEAFSAAFSAISAIVSGALKVVMYLWNLFGEDILSFVGKIFNTLLDVVSGFLDIFTGIFKLITSIIKGDWSGAWDAIKQILSGAVDVIWALIRGLWDTLGFLFNVGKDAIVAIMKAAWELVSGAVTDGIANVIRWVQGLPERASNALIGIGLALNARGLELLQGLWNGALDKYVALKGWVTDLPNKIKRAIGNLGSLLKNAGRDVINGFWNGLKDKWKDVTDWFGNITSKIPKLKGPMEVDRKILIPNGRAVLQGFSKGLAQEWTGVTRQLQGYTAALPAAASVGSNVGLRGTPVVNVTAQTNADPHEIGREIAWNLRKVGW